MNSHDGIATATLTSLKNGDYRVTASVSSGSQANQQVIFIGDQSTAALTLSVPSGDITVTNTAPLHMTATLQDKNGNPLKIKKSPSLCQTTSQVGSRLATAEKA